MKKMMQKIVVTGIFLGVIIGGVGLFYVRSGGNLEAQISGPTLEQSDVVILIIEDGFLPADISIQKGDTVAWVNESGEPRWPASNLHPTHRIYFEFDPKEPLLPGESWVFTFKKSGIWKYHDHLRPSKKGTIEVL